MRTRALAGAIALVGAFTACQMTAEVTTAISASGRASFGLVLAFDKQLLDVCRQTPQCVKALEDLRKIPAEFTSGGWTFTKTEPEGALRIETRRRFPTVEALNVALGELRSNASANSSATAALIQVFPEFEVQRRPGFLKSETRVSGLADVTPATLFGGTKTDAKTQQQINDFFSGPQASQLFRFRVRADLAGRITSSTGGPEVKGGSAVWSPRFGQQLRFSAAASAYNPFVLLVGGLVLAAVLAALVVSLVRRRRPRRPVPGWEVGVPAPEEPAPAETGGGTQTLPPNAG